MSAVSVQNSVPQEYVPDDVILAHTDCKEMDLYPIRVCLFF